MAVLLEDLVKSLEMWLNLIYGKSKQQDYVDPKLDPVLLVPGIAGSILNAIDEKTGKKERVWVRILGADHEFRTKLWSRFDPSTGKTESLDKSTSIEVPEDRYGLYAIDVLDPDMVIGAESVYYFHDMIVEMHKWGYQEGRTLFGFGYDFRQSNRVGVFGDEEEDEGKVIWKSNNRETLTTQTFVDWSLRLQGTLERLASKLESVYNASGGKKINIISHSMGGLLVKCFMSLHSDIFEKYVKNWIAIAAPFRGAPGYITSALLNGTSFVDGWEQNFFISKWSMHQLLIECPSIYELLPCPDFNWEHPPVLEVWRETNSNDGDSILMLETFSVKETLKIFTGALSCNTANFDGVDIPLPFNMEILRWANGTRDVLGNAKVPEGVKFYNIYGTSLQTPHSVRYGSEDAPVSDLQQLPCYLPKYVYVDGDGTVPVESAKADGLEAEARIGVPGEHRGILCDRHVFRILKHWLKADHDPFYNPVNDYVILPTSLEFERHQEKGLEITSFKEEWEIISEDLDDQDNKEDSISVSCVQGDGEARATIVVHPQSHGKKHVELNAASVLASA